MEFGITITVFVEAPSKEEADTKGQLAAARLNSMEDLGLNDAQVDDVTEVK